MNFDDMLGALDARHGVNGEGEGHFCDCAELIVRGVRVPVPPGHDCEYVRAARRWSQRPNESRTRLRAMTLTLGRAVSWPRWMS